ncbi:adenylate/guanylate cyclase domain-containing protein [Trichocoleus sp. FACHB-262]|uniref:adenylate/guanylate cyclase domain-containing protein n=1 Tax=Trichocoleus sp. FACHB-262 TaxID=2692869 RepID=UPI0016859768|nr:adenylate/guanylate cyclase domain-containing protein [Trichocoleus sp. FACHB-262]MBD2120666.1 adenylate/guanylate cyclase domain-containing protein [Trichocoleus sp. FACHB-262]
MKKPVGKFIHQFRQWLPTLLEAPSEVEFNNYWAWRRRFLYKRLSLGLGLGLLYFSGLTGLYLIQMMLGDRSLNAVVFKNLLTALSMASWLVWLQLPVGKRQQAIAFLGLSWSITMLTNVPSALDPVLIPDLKGWTITFFAQATIIPFRWRLHLLSQLGAYAFFFSTSWLVSQQFLPASISATGFLFDMGWICLMSTLVVYLYERLSKAEFQTRYRLRQEQQRSEQLLLNILPPSIAERLLKQQQTIADSFAEVTVLFADIVGFTQLSTQMSPSEVVNLLNQVFSRFDELAEYHGLEKIKTIGDSYMVVAGLPQHRIDHASAIAQMALAMHQALKQLNTQTGHTLEIRTGIHTGPVVAGIIGLKKFAYDLWGDTVNTASRMESQGLPGEIQVSETTYECLKQQYVFEERGSIAIKGKGEMNTYLLRGKCAPEAIAVEQTNLI